MVSGHSSRAIKYRHLAEEGLGLRGEQLAVLCVLLLRGPQTAGELKQRTERLSALSSLEAVDDVLATLVDKGYVRRAARQPGQKEDRFEQLLGGRDNAGPAAPSAAGQPKGPAAADGNGLQQRVDALERHVAQLQAALRELREQLGEE
jgi:uncharacterized protein YceH (UPF0502 family)